jgi:tetratricopeptide (TPR) repeat protein
MASRDGRAALRFADQIADLPDYYGSRSKAPALRAEALSLLHDAAGARVALRKMGPDDATILRATASINPQAPYLLLAFNEERWADAASTMEPLRTLMMEITGVDPWTFPVSAADAAKVFTGVGRLEEAEALIANTPLDCYDCVLARAGLSEKRGDRARADHWFGEAVRIGPSLAAAPLAFGRARLARGDTSGALAQFREANRRAPRWADPLKFWGDALLAQGDAAGAIRKYQAAAEQAPRWGALHLAWGRALAAQGRSAQARVQWRVAAGLELSPADRTEMTRRLSSAGSAST